MTDCPKCTEASDMVLKERIDKVRKRLGTLMTLVYELRELAETVDAEFGYMDLEASGKLMWRSNEYDQRLDAVAVKTQQVIWELEDVNLKLRALRREAPHRVKRELE